LTQPRFFVVLVVSLPKLVFLGAMKGYKHGPILCPNTIIARAQRGALKGPLLGLMWASQYRPNMAASSGQGDIELALPKMLAYV
jgi:hypothetical protein